MPVTMITRRLGQKAPAWIFLAFTIAMTKLSWLARHRLPHKQTFVDMWLSLIPSEMSHYFLLANILALGHYLRKYPSTIGSIPGILALLLSVRSTSRYWNILTHSFQARMYFRDTLAQTGIQPLDNLGSLSLYRLFLCLVPLYPLMSKDVTVRRGVVFATVGKVQLKMDVYKSKHCPRNAPVLLYIHGGGWVVGTRSFAMIPFLYEVARAGWVVCAIDYRLAPRSSYPAQLIDCKRAVAFIRQHGKSLLQANPNFIVTGGESAGGHLALMMAFSANNPIYQPGFEDVDTTIKGCIDLFGVHDLADRNGFHSSRLNDGFVKFIQRFVIQQRLSSAKEEFDAASPIALISEVKRKKIPPIMTVHGALDTLVPVEDSREFHYQLKVARQEAGQIHVKDVYIEIPGTHHVFACVPSPRTFALGDAAVSFLLDLYCSEANELERDSVSSGDDNSESLRERIETFEARMNVNSKL